MRRPAFCVRSRQKIRLPLCIRREFPTAKLLPGRGTAKEVSMDRSTVSSASGPAGMEPWKLVLFGSRAQGRFP